MNRSSGRRGPVHADQLREPDHGHAEGERADEQPSRRGRGSATGRTARTRRRRAPCGWRRPTRRPAGRPTRSSGSSTPRRPRARPQRRSTAGGGRPPEGSARTPTSSSANRNSAPGYHSVGKKPPLSADRTKRGTSAKAPSTMAGDNAIPSRSVSRTVRGGGTPPILRRRIERIVATILRKGCHQQACDDSRIRTIEASRALAYPQYPNSVSLLSDSALAATVFRAAEEGYLRYSCISEATERSWDTRLMARRPNTMVGRPPHADSRN